MFAVPFDPAANMSGRAGPGAGRCGGVRGGTQVWLPLVGVDTSGSIAYVNKGGTATEFRG